MARRRQKKRTHAGALKTPAASGKNAPGSRNPKSMVIRMGAGEVGPSISQLAKDVRAMMEPDTASRLKERKSNKLRDYTTMAGPLGVTHLLLFSRSTSGNTNMRLALTPRGPTLHFRVEKYSLCKDVRKALRHPKGGSLDYRTAPLLVMNNFTSPQDADSSKRPIPKQLESLTTSVFQSLFPAISPQTTPLSSIRRVLLLNREPASPHESPDAAEPEEDGGSYVLNLRHFAITTRSTGLSRPLRRLNAAEKMMRAGKSGNVRSIATKRGGVPNLGKLDDVADFILDPSAGATGFTSGSESEAETDAEVEVLETNARKVLSRQKREQQRAKGSGPNDGGGGANRIAGASGVEKRAVKLVELGPRMRLRMTKVEEGVCGGKVMWHEYVKKTKEEVKAMEKVWEGRKRERDERKRVQRENVERKRKERGGKPGAKGKAGGEEAEEDVDMGEADDDEDDWDSDLLDDEDDDEDETADPDHKSNGKIVADHGSVT